MADVSALIVNWNARDHLEACLASLADTPAEVVVVDNGSEDGSAAMVTEAYPAVRLLASPANLGFAGGVNAGAAAATGRLLLILNPDTAAHPGAVDRLTAFLDGHPEAGAVAARLVGPDGLPQRGWNVRRLPTFASLAADLLLLHRLWPSNPVTRRYHALDLDDSTAVEVEQPAAACLMVRRGAFEQVGGMDDRFYPAWFEDVDFCARLRTAGWRLFLEPAAVFTHRGGVARDRLARPAFARIWYRNLQRYVLKQMGPATLAALKPFVLSGLGLRAAAAAMSGDLRGAGHHARLAADALMFWPGRGADRRPHDGQRSM